MFRGILPKEFNFFDYFEKHVALTIKAGNELLNITPGEGIAQTAKKINEMENEADGITHTCTEKLHKTFITPFERTDIHNLIKNLDDIIDYVDGAVSRMVYYEIEDIRPETRQLAEILIKSAVEIQDALKAFRNIKKNTELIQEKCKNIHQLESEGDNVLRAAVLRLFKEGEAIPAIMWKEIFERLEKAIDRCEAVANIIEGVVIGSS